MRLQNRRSSHEFPKQETEHALRFDATAEAERERESICLTARYGVLLSRLPKTLLTQGWAPDMSPKPQSEVKCSTFKPACSDESTYASRCAQWSGGVPSPIRMASKQKRYPAAQ